MDFARNERGFCVGFAWNLILFSFVREREGYKHHADCTVPATFLWRICVRMKFHFRMYGVTRRMKRTYDVSTAYALRSILICNATYLFCNNFDLISIRTSGCVHFVDAIRALQ